jgi:hypothetical protein
MSGDPKAKIIGWSVAGVIGVCIVWVGIVAAIVGGEASKLDSSMKASLTHSTADDIKKQISDMGFTLGNDSPSALSATGPHHMAVVYNTWLTLDVQFGQDGKATGYHIDRASGWF